MSYVIKKEVLSDVKKDVVEHVFSKMNAPSNVKFFKNFIHFEGTNQQFVNYLDCEMLVTLRFIEFTTYCGYSKQVLSIDFEGNMLNINDFHYVEVIGKKYGYQFEEKM